MHNAALLLLCFLSVLIWPVNRYVMKSGAKMENLGLVISLTTFVSGLILALIQEKEIFVFPASLFGIGMGCAYAIGFCMIIFYCLKIGPAGPTTALNNLGVLFPTVLSLTLFSKTKDIKLLTLLGVIFTVSCLVLMVFSGSKQGEIISKKWKQLVFIGWIFSGFSLSMQFLATYYSPESSLAFSVSTYFTSFLLLLAISVIRKNFKVSKVEFFGGVINGFTSVFMMMLLFYTTKYIEGYIVFPVILILPILFMMVTGHFYYKERLNSKGWIAAAFGAIGIILMYI